MNRRRFVLVAVALAAGALIPAVTATSQPPLGSGTVPELDFKGQLEKGLKARRPVEFQFIARVIDLVNDGTLPRKVVESTFLWARKKPDHKFQYFQFALAKRAKKLGVTI